MVYKREVIGAALWESTIPVIRRMMYQFQLNYARKFGRHNVTAMGLMKREEYARGSMFKNYREDWVFRTTYDSIRNISSNSMAPITDRNSSVRVTGSNFSPLLRRMECC